MSTNTQHDAKPPLSVVYDTQGHKIERYPGNILHISRVDHARPVTHDEAKTVAEWFWKNVAILEATTPATTTDPTPSDVAPSHDTTTKGEN